VLRRSQSVGHPCGKFYRQAKRQSAHPKKQDGTVHRALDPSPCDPQAAKLEFVTVVRDRDADVADADVDADADADADDADADADADADDAPAPPRPPCAPFSRAAPAALPLRSSSASLRALAASATCEPEPW